MPRISKQELGSMGSKIMQYAKAYRVKHPSAQWRTCVSEGAKMLKRNK